MPVPYAGNPANYPKTVDILSGSDAPNTTNFNTAWEGSLDRTAFLNGAIVASQGANWQRLVNVNPNIITVGTYNWCGTWDAFNEQWIIGNSVLFGATPNAQLNYSYNGQDWFPINPGLSNPTWFTIAVATGPFGVIATVRTDFGSHHSVTTQQQGLASVENSVTGSGTFVPGQGIMVFFDSAQGAALKTWLFVGASGHPGTFPWTGMACSGTFGSLGPPVVTTWTNLQTSLPTNWGAGGTNMILQYLAVIDESFPLAGDCNSVVFAQCGWRHGVDASYLLKWDQSSPTTFTDITPAFLAGGTYQIRGLAWSAVDQLWGMIVTDGDMNGHGASPPSSYFLTSPDLVTWTTVFTFIDFMAGGLACNGNIWSVIVYNAFLGNSSNRVLFSNNVSLGIFQSWESSDYMDRLNLGQLAVVGTPARLFLGNSAQFMTAYLFGGTALGPTFLSDAGCSAIALNGLG